MIFKMQLSPLQSRLAASILASCLVLIIYLFLFSPHFALAAELGASSFDPDLGNVANLLTLAAEEDSSETLDLRNPTYEPEFAPFDRSIIGRAPAGVTGLSNNAPQQQNLPQGVSATFMFDVSSVSGREAAGTGVAPELKRRAADDASQSQDGSLDEETEGQNEDELVQRATPSKTLWISANTCLQPERPEANKTTLDAPQLTLYVSTSSDNMSPGPMADKKKQKVVVFNEGAVMYKTTLDQDVYFAVSAPNVSDWFTTSTYNVEVAASVDESYHTFDDRRDPNVFWVDSDAAAALLITGNLTNSSTIPAKMPYTIFAFPKDDVSSIGVRNSYCGLKQYSLIGGTKAGMPPDMMSTGMTMRDGNVPKQEFYFTRLNRSTTYEAILAQEPGLNLLGKRDNVPGGGGIVFRQTNFTTKSTDNCMILNQLKFCDQIAYSVPGNETKFSGDKMGQLRDFYDNFAKEMYDNFEKALAQIPCETYNTSKYSLVRGCDDCKVAYKKWICSVAIPRCQDFSSSDSFLQMRNINAQFPDGSRVDASIREQFGQTIAYNSSRVPAIDTVVSPGPYKEVLPCDDLCYDIVQSCPASLEFGCPQPGMRGYNTSYARRQNEGDNVTCNYPGSAHIKSASSVLHTSAIYIAGPLLIAALLLAL